MFKVALTARVQGDLHAPAGLPDEMDFDVARRRVGVTGALTSHLEFEVERELEGGGDWRDVFVNVRTVRAAQMQAGRFKMPFSRDQLTGAGSLDFISRSRAADLLAPGRSTGVAVHGRVARQVLGYDVGVFTHDGDVVPTTKDVTGSGPAVAGRVTVRPRGNARRSGALSDIELGVNATGGDVPAGRHSLRGRSTSKDVFFSPVFVQGHRLRVGGDLDWRPGPFGFRAEYLRADDARQHQGLTGDTLPALRGQGWYLSGVWALAGRRAHAGADNRLAFAGVNGLELAARVERVWFGTPGAADGAVRTPRSTDLPPVSDRVWTLGANWTLNRLVRVQLNGVLEQVTDRARNAPQASRDWTWSPMARVQIAM
jgi:phosphate-selective porin